MKAWLVRFVSLYVFNAVVLLIIGWVTPANVGWAALWAGVLLTAATIWLKPAIAKGFRGAASKSAASRTGFGERLVQYGIVFVAELIIWIVVVLLSGVSVRGFFWGWVIPPILLLIAWAIYAAIDDKVEAQAGALYDKATGATTTTAATPSVTDAKATAEGRAELDDGLTPEQRKMLDDLG